MKISNKTSGHSLTVQLKKNEMSGSLGLKGLNKFSDNYSPLTDGVKLDFKQLGGGRVLSI